MYCSASPASRTTRPRVPSFPNIIGEVLVGFTPPERLLRALHMHPIEHERDDNRRTLYNVRSCRDENPDRRLPLTGTLGIVVTGNLDCNAETVHVGSCDAFERPGGPWRFSH